MFKVGDKVLFSKYKQGEATFGVIEEISKHNGDTLWAIKIRDREGKVHKLTTFSYLSEEKRRIKKVTNSFEFIMVD